MSRRVPQPAIDRARRPTEGHEFWPAFVFALIGLLLAVGGGLRLTGVETTGGGTAWEVQLVRAFSNGGLRYAEIAASGGLPDPSDPTGAQAAFRRAEDWRRAGEARSKVRVDLGATTPCPT